MSGVLQFSDRPSRPPSMDQIVERVSTVCSIELSNIRGTGFVVSWLGQPCVLTNHHVRRAWFGGAAHLQACRMSSVSMISLTDSEVVTGRCGLGIASTCERRAGAWQHSATRSASWSASVVRCCTCSQMLAVAVDEVGARNFR